MLYLASASPRRRELLDQLCLRYQVITPQIDETPLVQESPQAYVTRLAHAKARAGQYLLGAEEWVLAADTAVICQGKIFGKPRHGQEACEMLQQLSGQSHQVLTAIVLAQGERCLSRVSATTVYFRLLSGSEIQAYILTGEPFDKAGAYAIQGLASIFIERIEGSYSGVMGLPLYETAELLQQMGGERFIWEGGVVIQTGT
jgi:septum formation protein